MSENEKAQLQRRKLVHRSRLRDRYRVLRDAGMSGWEAGRVCQWSIPHIAAVYGDQTAAKIIAVDQIYREVQYDRRNG